MVATATDRSGVANTSEFGGAAPITSAADVQITKTGPASVTPGTSISYSLVVTNNGPNDATGVTVADVTPTGLTFVSTTGACTTPFPCVLGTLASGQSAAITVTFAVPAFYVVPNPIVNTASVSSQASESDLSNNSATTNVLVGLPRADLAITKGRPLRRGLGANLVYTIVVTNHGPSDVPDATVVDPTPAGLTFVGNAGACATAFPCALGPIPAGQSRTITTTFLVPSGYTGPDPIVNTATVNSTAIDPDLDQQLGNGHDFGRAVVHRQCRDLEGGPGERDAGAQSRLFHSGQQHRHARRDRRHGDGPDTGRVDIRRQCRRLHDTLSLCAGRRAGGPEPPDHHHLCGAARLCRRPIPSRTRRPSRPRLPIRT